MRMTKVRETMAAIAALVLIFALLVGASVALGWDIPILNRIAGMLGFGS